LAEAIKAVLEVQAAHDRVAGPADPVFGRACYGMGSVFQKAGQGNYLDFLAPGIIAWRLFSRQYFPVLKSSGTGVWLPERGDGGTDVAFGVMVGRTIGGATVAFCREW